MNEGAEKKIIDPHTGDCWATDVLLAKSQKNDLLSSGCVVEGTEQDWIIEDSMQVKPDRLDTLGFGAIGTDSVLKVY